MKLNTISIFGGFLLWCSEPWVSMTPFKIGLWNVVGFFRVFVVVAVFNIAGKLCKQKAVVSLTCLQKWVTTPVLLTVCNNSTATEAMVCSLQPLHLWNRRKAGRQLPSQITFFSSQQMYYGISGFTMASPGKWDLQPQNTEHLTTSKLPIWKPEKHSVCRITGDTYWG